MLEIIPGHGKTSPYRHNRTSHRLYPVAMIAVEGSLAGNWQYLTKLRSKFIVFKKIYFTIFTIFLTYLDSERVPLLSCAF